MIYSTLLWVAWYVLGLVGFVHNYTKQYDITTSEIFLAIIAGLLGPLSFPIGAWIHDDADGVILFKRKVK